MSSVREEFLEKVFIVMEIIQLCHVLKLGSLSQVRRFFTKPR